MDNTEAVRKIMVVGLNAQVETNDETTERARLVTIHGESNVWNTDELRAKFEVIGFAAPCCVVRERETGKKGSVFFQHSPRFYFDHRAD